VGTLIILAVLAQPQVEVRGTLHARGNGGPIAFAQLSAEDGASAETDAEGRFELRTTSSRVTVTAAGFRPETFETTPSADWSLTPTRPSARTVVRGSRAEDARVSLTGPELREIPGTGGDPFKAAMVMPGVASVTSGLPIPVVRGSSPAATGVFVDEVRVPQVFHSFLGPPVINPALIESLELYTSNPPVQYSQLLAGAIDAHLSRPSDQPRAIASADLLSASAFVEVPIKQTGTSVMLAGRLSYTAPLLGLVGQVFSPGERTVTDFWDYQGRIEQKAGGGTLRLLAFGSSDSFGSQSEQAVGLQAVRFHRVDLRYRHALGPGVAEAGVTVGEDQFNFFTQDPFSETGVVEGYASRRTDIDQLAFSGRAKWSASLGDAWKVAAGATAERRSADWASQELYQLVVQPQPFQFKVVQPHAAALWLGAWSEATWTSTRLSITGAIRVDHFRALENLTTDYAPPPIERTSADPRISLRYQATDALALRFSAGLYHQAPTFLVNMPIVDLSTGSYGFQEAVQTSAGATWKFWRGFELSGDVFVNPMLRLVEYALFDDERVTSFDAFRPGAVQPSQFGAPRESSGLAYGADVMLRWPLGDHFFGWVTVTLQQSVRWESYWQTSGTEFTNETSGQLPYAFDQAVNANAVLSYRFDNGFSLGATLHFNTGHPESGQLSSRTHVPSADGSQWLFLSRDRVERLPPYFRADVRVAKTWMTDLLTIETYLDLFNASFMQEPTGFSYLGGKGAPLTKQARGPPIVVPTIGVKVAY
jgi:hypothetical protein